MRQAKWLPGCWQETSRVHLEVGSGEVGRVDLGHSEKRRGAQSGPGVLVWAARAGGGGPGGRGGVGARPAAPLTWLTASGVTRAWSSHLSVLGGSHATCPQGRGISRVRAFPTSHTHAASPCPRLLIKYSVLERSLSRAFNSCHTEGSGGQRVSSHTAAACPVPCVAAERLGGP